MCEMEVKLEFDSDAMTWCVFDFFCVRESERETLFEFFRDGQRIVTVKKKDSIRFWCFGVFSLIITCNTHFVTAVVVKIVCFRLFLCERERERNLVRIFLIV